MSIVACSQVELQPLYYFLLLKPSKLSFLLSFKQLLSQSSLFLSARRGKIASSKFDYAQQKVECLEDAAHNKTKALIKTS